MAEALIVFCTCANHEEAEHVANTVVEQFLAACVNILPPVRSVYRWQGAVERAEEVLLLIKTTPGQLTRLTHHIQAIHSYDTPEIVAIPIAGGSERYLEWLGEQVH